MPGVNVKEPECIGCKICIKSCPYDAIDFDEDTKKASINDKCTVCGACIPVCPEDAIVSEIEIVTDLSEYKDVWVFAEHRDGALAKVGLQLLGCAQGLAADVGERVCAVLVGHQVDDFIPTLFEYGADIVYHVDAPELKTYRFDTYTKVMVELVRTYSPNMFLLGATHIGRDLAPRVSRRLNAGLTADCTELTIDPETKLLKVPRKMVNLEEAKIIVSGGRGVGSTAGFKVLEELAEVLEAELGGSRVAVEKEWISQDHQVGQTGKSVRPDLYIACGISGSIQHRAGMQSSGIIVVINKDPDAYLFKIADYGIVGDLHTVVPLLTEAFRKELGK